MIGDLGKAVLGITKAYQLGKVLKSGFTGTKKNLEAYKGKKTSLNNKSGLKAQQNLNKAKAQQLQQMKLANQQAKQKLSEDRYKAQALKLQNQQAKVNANLAKQRATAEKLKAMGFGPNPNSVPRKRPARVAGGNIRAKKYGNRYNY